MATPKPNPPAPAAKPRLGRRAALVALLAVALAAYFASGFFFVQPDERAVVRVFGRVVEKQGMPGLHYVWPWPVGRVDKPKTTAIQRVTVGLDPETRTAIAAGDLVAQSQSALSDVFTGDVNIVKATMVAQYQITAADQYVTRTVDPDRLAALAVQAVMVQTIGGYSIDDALTQGKAQIQNATRERAQAMLDRFGCGITLREVTLESLEPPYAIADAFRDVASAKKDCEKSVDQAESYANSVIPTAQGRAYEMLAEARGYREQRVQQARGAADRFRAIHAEYVKAPAVTRARMLLSALAGVCQRAKTYVFTPNREGPPMKLTIGQSGAN